MKQKKTIKDGVYIPTVQCKDIYNSNHLVSDSGATEIDGYSLYYNTKKGDRVLNLNKFISCFDYSLELIKLEDIYKKLFRKNDFFTTINGKNYSTKVISLEFGFALRNFNKAGRDYYVKDGYALNQLEFTNGVCIKDEELIGIKTNEVFDEVIDIEEYTDCFTIVNGMYVATNKIEILKKCDELRKHTYVNGFICDGIKYVRYKRSAGSSRTGKCLFIQESLYDRIHKWECCGLDIKEGMPIDLASFEAYIALTTSSIIDTIEIQPENILVIDDFESIFQDNVIKVGTEDNKIVAEEGMATIKNSIFDGESIIDVSLLGIHAKHGMNLLRNRMCKTAAFTGRVQKFLKDNNITDISQLNGKTIATKIEDIKFITTPSSIKYLKFGSLKQWLKNIDTTFGIVKHEKPTHFFDGRMVQSHYQLINTCELHKKDVEKLIAPSLDYIYKLRTDPDVLKWHIKCPEVKDVTKVAPIVDTNQAIYRIMSINDSFKDTQLYSDFRRSIIKSSVRKLKQGHVLINGNYSTLFGNGYEMLLQSIGKFDGKSELGVGNIYCKNFKWGEKVLGSRSPHVCSGNVYLATNTYNENIEKYFCLTKEIVCVNAINENIQQRLNGCDYDSDTMLLTNNPILIKAAEKNYNIFKVPVCEVDASKTKRYYTNEDKADLDTKTSDNKIGDIINLSQQLNSLLWDRVLGQHQTIKENMSLYIDICKLAVLSGIEIDKAKKEFLLNTAQELKILKEKYSIFEDEKVVKPMFFKMITLENGYKLSDRHLYKYFHTPMDYLSKQVNSFNFRNLREKHDYIPFSDLLRDEEQENVTGTAYYTQRDKIIQIIVDMNYECKKLYSNDALILKQNREKIYVQCQEIRKKGYEQILKMNMPRRTVKLLIRAIESPEYKNLKTQLFTILYSLPNNQFLEMLKDNNTKYTIIEVNEDEKSQDTFSLYDFKYRKTCSSAA